jgi:hypothetical protein
MNVRGAIAELPLGAKTARLPQRAGWALAVGLVAAALVPGGAARAADATAAAALAASADSAADGAAMAPVSTAPWDRATSNGAMALSDIEPGRPAGDARLVGTVVHLHIVDETLRRALGGQSGRLVVDMDCRSGWFRSRDMVVWSGPYESGPARPLRTSAEWSAAGGGQYLSKLTRSVCEQAGLTAQAAPEPEPALVKAAVLTLPGRRDSRLARVESAPQAARPIPAAEVAGTYHVQFVASRSERAVKDLVAREAPRLAQALGDQTLSVQRAAVGGQIFYRGRVGAFADADAAKAFCRTLGAHGLPCLLTH